MSITTSSVSPDRIVLSKFIERDGYFKEHKRPRIWQEARLIKEILAVYWVSSQEAGWAVLLPDWPIRQLLPAVGAIQSLVLGVIPQKREPGTPDFQRPDESHSIKRRSFAVPWLSRRA